MRHTGTTILQASQYRNGKGLWLKKLATATPDSDGGIVYRLTDEGANVLSEVFEIKITL